MPKQKKPAKKKVDVSINLVPQDPFFETILGRTLKWALSIGRYIVIFTEMVVIISFATRFTLDRQVTDLNASINQKQKAIESYGDLEKEFRFVQQQIDDYQQLKQDYNLVEIFPILNSTIPDNVVFETLIVKADTINFSGVALSQTALNILINNMQLDNHFYDVRISRIESQNELSNAVMFDITSNISLEGGV
jgi:Tfp pilus assembly protein PilN